MAKAGSKKATGNPKLQLLLQVYTPLGGGYIAEVSFFVAYPLLLAGTVPTTSELRCEQVAK